MRPPEPTPFDFSCQRTAVTATIKATETVIGNAAFTERISIPNGELAFS
jgi:hypothetical protein